jgi:SMODS-associating 4TM effector domain
LNKIPIVQNEEANLRLQRARNQTYARAKVLFYLQLVLTVVVPVGSALWALFVPEWKPFAAFAALTIALLDVTFLDRAQRQLLRVAAKIGEERDCEILELQWNEFTVGKRVEPETIHCAATAYAKRNDDDKLRDWYSPVVGKVPIHLARIICQRTNLWYDAKLRKYYGGTILALAALLVFVLFLSALITDRTMTSFVMSVMAPAAPVLIWSVREHYRQRDTANLLDNIRGQAEVLWDRAKNGRCKPGDCAVQSREFQNAIYTHRATNPLVLPPIYALLRSSMEQQMHHAAEHWVRDAGYEV